MKVKMMENFRNKRGLMGCKRSSLNAQGTENPLSHSFLGLEEFPFPIIDPLGPLLVNILFHKWVIDPNWNHMVAIVCLTKDSPNLSRH